MTSGQAAPDDTTRSRPDPISISPGTGPLPPIYLPPPGQPGPAGLLWHAAVRAVRGALARQAGKPTAARSQAGW